MKMQSRDLPMAGIDMQDPNHQKERAIYIGLHCMR